jgi:hypothetical protein
MSEARSTKLHSLIIEELQRIGNLEVSRETEISDRIYAVAVAAVRAYCDVVVSHARDAKGNPVPIEPAKEYFFDCLLREWAMIEAELAKQGNNPRGKLA